MNTLQKTRAEAWPISRESNGARPVLEQVIIKSNHPKGSGTIRLTPDQALYVHSRLSIIATAYLDGHNGQVHRFGVHQLPEDHVGKMSMCGAKVWPISHVIDESPAVLEEVVVEGDHPQGHGEIHLSPEQARYIQSRLSQITIAFLHENVWGGEDARIQ